MNGKLGPPIRNTHADAPNTSAFMRPWFSDSVDLPIRTLKHMVVQNYQGNRMVWKQFIVFIYYYYRIFPQSLFLNANFAAFDI